jgi:uncharacterized protein YdhG (YjbR/CyaY superfamily)
MSPEFKSYFDQFSKQSQQRLIEVYEICKYLLPEATEKMSYGMPCVSLKQNVVYFAALKKLLWSLTYCFRG